MAIEFKKQADPGNTLFIRVQGKLHKEDYELFVPEVERMIEERGKISLFLEMHDFHGWDMSALWEDIKFDAKHFKDIERIAMIGENKWQKWMSSFCKPFTTAKVRFFEPSQKDDARVWVTGMAATTN